MASEATPSPLPRRANEVRGPPLNANTQSSASFAFLTQLRPLLFSVIALDTSPTRLALARHNAFQYGVADRIEFILGDFVSFARSLSSTSSSSSSDSSRKPLNGIDAVFLSPPWGGISYETLGTPSASTPSDTPVGPAIYPLAALQPLHGKELFDLARSITDDVGYYLPRNVDLEEVRALVGEEERVEVEEEIMGGKIKALTCLFGGLAGRR